MTSRWNIFTKLWHGMSHKPECSVCTTYSLYVQFIWTEAFGGQKVISNVEMDCGKPTFSYINQLNDYKKGFKTKLGISCILVIFQCSQNTEIRNWHGKNITFCALLTSIHISPFNWILIITLLSQFYTYSNKHYLCSYQSTQTYKFQWKEACLQGWIIVHWCMSLIVT